MNEAAEKRRDQRLRRVLLRVLHMARPFARGGLPGKSLMDEVDGIVPSGQGFEDDTHAAGLMRDLVNAELATEEPLPRRRTQRDGIDFRFYRITHKGSQLLLEAIPPNPLIDDERVTEENET